MDEDMRNTGVNDDQNISSEENSFGENPDTSADVRETADYTEVTEPDGSVEMGDPSEELTPDPVSPEDPAPGFEADNAAAADSAASEAAAEDIAGQAVPPQDRPHDFDVEEPKFDTQTGERLDRPKKKYPGIILTFVVTAMAIGAFVYAVLPGRLPSSNVNEQEDADTVETETLLAIASQETEEAVSLSPAVLEDTEAEETEPESVIMAVPAEETEAEETEPESVIMAVSAAETESEIADETEAETEAETETEGAADKAPGEKPEFKTEGVILSASLDVSDMVEEVMPGIVSITCTNIKTVRDFFYGIQQIRETGAGSGIIVDEDEDTYYILTDAWIVSGADEVTVGFSVSKDATKELSDEDTLAQAEVIGMDKDTELAMLAVKKDSVNEVVQGQVKPSVLGDSDVIRVGERAIAIGNAMGYGLSVTEGIISALNRQMQTGAGVQSFIQTDASINYGNYGGALMNAAGEVIGINSGKISRDSGEGMGYAFPINSAKEAISEMIGRSSFAAEETEADTETAAEEEETEKSSGKVMLQVAEEETEETPEKQTEEIKETEIAAEEPETQAEEPETQAEGKETQAEKPASGSSEGGMLGVSVADVSDEYSIIYRIPKGAYIAEVVDGSGAMNAGLRKDDVIIRINDTDITGVADLKDALSSTKPGDKVKVTYVRPDSSGSYDEDRPSSATVTLQ